MTCERSSQINRRPSLQRSSAALPNPTVVASLQFPPGSWVVFATVALAGNAGTGTTVSVQMFFELDGKIYGEDVQSSFTITDQSGSVVGFQVVPFTTGLVLDTPLQVVCVATPKDSAVSQPTTITAIEVGSVTRIT
jgi:hypothetical protein